MSTVSSEMHWEGESVRSPDASDVTPPDSSSVATKGSSPTSPSSKERAAVSMHRHSCRSKDDQGCQTSRSSESSCNSLFAMPHEALGTGVAADFASPGTDGRLRQEAPADGPELERVHSMSSCGSVLPDFNSRSALNLQDAATHHAVPASPSPLTSSEGTPASDMSISEDTTCDAMHMLPGQGSPPSGSSQRSTATCFEGELSQEPESEPSEKSHEAMDLSPGGSSQEDGKPTALGTCVEESEELFFYLCGDIGPAIRVPPSLRLRHAQAAAGGGAGVCRTSTSSHSTSSGALLGHGGALPGEAAPLEPPLPHVKEDARTESFFRTLDKAYLVVQRRDLTPVGASIQTLCSHVGPVKFRNKVYMLKEPAIINWARVESELDMYRRMADRDHPSLQKKVTKAFEDSFDILDEARILIHCRDLPGVVRLEGVSIATHPCRRVTGFLLEYLPRGNLYQLLVSGPQLQYIQKIALAREMACIVESLHGHGVVHGDLKPSQFLVADDGSLRLCDFGGSGPYMAPELYAGAINTVASDIFGFGEILFDLMEQHMRLKYESTEVIEEHYKAGDVFYKDAPREDWPAEWRDLVRRCMAVQPEDRPLLSDVIAQLTTWLDREVHAH